MSWLDKLKQYAPDIALAIASGGATLPQLAIRAVAEATGATGLQTRGELEAMIEAAEPADLERIRQANNAFKIRMAELGNELTRSELADVQHAREVNSHSRMPAVICCAMTIMVAAGAYLLFTQPIPEANGPTVYLLFGAVLTKWGDSIAYWVGTTRSSANKTILIGKPK